MPDDPKPFLMTGRSGEKVNFGPLGVRSADLEPPRGPGLSWSFESSLVPVIPRIGTLAPTSFFEASSVYEDTAMQIRARADGDSVAAMRDKSWNDRQMVQVTEAKRPVLRSAGGKSRVDFDGVDDYLSCARPGHSATAEVHMSVKLPASLEAPRYECLYGARSASSTLASYLAVVRPSDGVYQIWGAGGSNRAVYSSGVESLMGTTCVLGYSHDGSTIRLYLNGAQISQVAQASTAAGTVAPFLGALNGAGSATSFYSGDIYGGVVFDRLLDDAERQSVSDYLAV